MIMTTCVAETIDMSYRLACP